MGLGPLGLGQPSGELEMVGGIMVWSQNHCDGGGGNTGFGSGYAGIQDLHFGHGAKDGQGGE